MGQTYNATNSETCTFTGSSVPSTATMTTNGTTDAIESVTTAAGTFRAFKYTATYVHTNANYVATTVETCWTDMVLGRAVKCSTSYTTVQTSDQSVIAAGSSTSELTAYSVAGAAPVGSTLPRFVGSWRVNFAGAATGYCSSVSVTTAGAISSACVRTDGSGSVIGNFTVSGSVDVNGVVTVTGSDGSTLTGSLTSPTAGTGAWVNGSMSGTWTATHL